MAIPICTADVTIVGAALAGATLAHALGNAGYRVHLLEQRPLANMPNGPPGGRAERMPRSLSEEPAQNPLDSRSTALSRSSIQILDMLGLWQSSDHPLLREFAKPIEQVHVSQAGYFGNLRLSAATQNLDMLGAVLANQVYNRIVLERVFACPAVQIQSGVEITGIDYPTAASADHLQNPAGRSVTGSTASIDNDAIRVSFVRDNQQHFVQSRLLIAVDGANSTVRQLCGIEVRTTDYEQSAILLNVETENPNPGVAFERFTTSGPLACLPLGEKNNSIVYSVLPDEAQRLMALGDAAFLKHLQNDFGYRLGRLQRCGKRHLMPLALVESVTQTGNRLLLLGNAARGLHPVAGQGFNLALRDIGILLELLDRRCLQAVKTDATNESLHCPDGIGDDTGVQQQMAGDPGGADLLQEFEQLRRKDQSQTVRMTDTFARLFRGSNPVLSHLRAVGLLGLEHVPPLQLGFARRAMGLSTPQPSVNRLPYSR